jgi:hypothetical protein
MGATEADKIGALLRAAFSAGETEGMNDERYRYGFEAWLAENGDEVLAAVAELAAQIRAQEAAKVRALLAFRAGTAWLKRHGINATAGPGNILTALARDIADGTL